MNNKAKYNLFLFAICCWIMFSSCQQPNGNTTGSEYMPDMAHSIAYEANTYSYFSFNTWGSEEEYYEYAKPKLPVQGTVPRGYAGMQLDPANASTIQKSLNGTNSNAGIYIPVNGKVPYAYADTDEGRSMASQEIIQSPYPISEASLAHGKEMYNVYCGICHGEKADGLGYLVREDGGKYGAQPANFLLDNFVQATNGQFYHAIVYGKNMMGGYADKLSFSERWDVIHYIRSLQAKELKLEYSGVKNTLNNWATPISDIVVATETHESNMNVHEDNSHDEHHSGGDHHGHDEHHSNDGHH